MCRARGPRGAAALRARERPWEGAAARAAPAAPHSAGLGLLILGAERPLILLCV